MNYKIFRIGEEKNTYLMSIEYFDMKKENKKLNPTLRYRRYASTVTLNGHLYVIGGRKLG